MPLRDDLIPVYGPLPVEQVEQSPAYARLRARYGDDESFKRVNDEVEKAKKLLELAFAGKNRTEEVQKAIWELWRRRRNRSDRDLFYGLIASGYRHRPNHWTDDQKEHFDRAWTVIQSPYDFFLSFSSRSGEVAGDNPVNTRYAAFIRKEISDAVYDAADRKRTNLLAVTIHRLLSDAQHIGFFYPHTQGANKNIVTTLGDAVRGSIVFVQILQNILFVEPEPRPGSSEEAENYCHWEYMTALKTYGNTADGRSRIIFVGAENSHDQLVQLDDVPPAYDDWYAHASHNAVEYLEDAPELELHLKTVQAHRVLVRNKVKPLLDEFRRRLLKTVPA